MSTQQPIPTFLYGTAWKEDRTPSLVELALCSGFRAVDTANQRRHYFEAGVGQGLAAAYREGVVTRADLFLQTKFTYQPGQDHRLPYDPAASLAVQVAQSMANSLEHLGTDYVDSYVLHGPSSGYGWTDADAEVWQAMIKERDAGRTRLLGVSNVSLQHLEQMTAAHSESPTFVQNRCYARLGWDREVRQFCTERKIIYQGFSLLTANVERPAPSAGHRPRRADQRHSSPNYFQFRPRRRHAPAHRHLQRRPHAARPGQPRPDPPAGRHPGHRIPVRLTHCIGSLYKPDIRAPLRLP